MRTCWPVKLGKKIYVYIIKIRRTNEKRGIYYEPFFFLTEYGGEMEIWQGLKSKDMVIKPHLRHMTIIKSWITYFVYLNLSFHTWNLGIENSYKKELFWASNETGYTGILFLLTAVNIANSKIIEAISPLGNTGWNYEQVQKKIYIIHNWPSQKFFLRIYRLLRASPIRGWHWKK